MFACVSECVCVCGVYVVCVRVIYVCGVREYVRLCMCVVSVRAVRVCFVCGVCVWCVCMCVWCVYAVMCGEWLCDCVTRFCAVGARVNVCVCV